MGHARDCWCNTKCLQSAPGWRSDEAVLGEGPASATTSEGTDNFETIQGDKDVEDEWTIVVPEARYGKAYKPRPVKVDGGSHRQQKIQGLTKATSLGGFEILNSPAKSTTMNIQATYSTVSPSETEREQNEQSCTQGLEDACACEWPSLQEAMNIRPKSQATPTVGLAKKRETV